MWRPAVTLAAVFLAAPIAAGVRLLPLVGKWNVEWAGGATPRATTVRSSGTADRSR